MTDHKPEMFLIILLFVAQAFLPISLASAQNSGEDIFKGNCVVCHTIGGGPLVGPDLIGVNTRHSEVWLIDFIQSSQTLIANGDEKATKLFNDFFMIPMPDQPFNDEQVRSVLEYIASKTLDTQEPVIETEIQADTQPLLADDSKNGLKPDALGLASYILIGVMGIETVTVLILISTIVFLIRNIKSLQQI